jgi:hypothetical protein
LRKKISILFFALISTAMVMAGGPPAVYESKPFRANTCRSDFGSYALTDGSSAEVVRDFITGQIPNLQNKQTALNLTFSTTSPGGYHYTFCQTYQGVPVFGAEVRVNVSRQNQVYSIFDDSYDMSKWKVNMTDFDYQNSPAYQAYVRQYFSGEINQTAKHVVAYDESAGNPEFCYLITVKDKSGHQRDVLLARDRIIYEHDACMYRAPAPAVDSLVTGMVFKPDPLTTAHAVYYGPYLGVDSMYQNFNDMDTPALNLQREQKSFYASYDNGVFSLSNQYIQLGQLGSDQIPPVTSPTPTFNYTRSQNGFLDVMVFYHANVIRDYVHSLGFNAADVLVTADSHASTQDNDFFAEPNSIFYGTGGVPDCQDADVIIHEYTHFLSWNANQSNGVGASSQRNSVDEGSADYNATSYSASIDTFRWYNMFSWDGHNPYWPGRLVNDRTVYPSIPNAPGLNGIYKYSVIWSSALMEIWWDIGRGPADSLFFQTLYGLGSNITLRDAAQQYIKADSVLFSGQYHCTIERAFYNHGLASDTACGLYPLAVSEVVSQSDFAKFTAYPDGFKAVAAEGNTPLNIDLYDIAGQRISSYTNVTGEIKPDLPNGIYIVDVSAAGAHQAFKWALVR